MKKVSILTILFTLIAGFTIAAEVNVFNARHYKADAELYEAKKQAEAVKVEADAEAYAVKIKAEADAKQTELISEAINNNGQSAINYEIMKRQVEGLSDIASSNQTKTLFIPSDITKALGTLELFLDGIVNKEVKNDN